MAIARSELCYALLIPLNLRLATGSIMIWLTSQAIINMGMVSVFASDWCLPFISYGGSSLSSLFTAGFVVGVCRSELRCVARQHRQYIENQSAREVRRANADWKASYSVAGCTGSGGSGSCGCWWPPAEGT